MDITTTNFEEAYPVVESAIEAADFVAIDGEFTGIRNGPDASAYDTPADYYQKLRDSCVNFLLVQVGLCTFRFDAKKKKYIHQAFNFYVFPKSSKNREMNFLCQVSCINFLSNMGFDFNKLFKEGIPYLSAAEEQLQRTELEAKKSHFGEVKEYSKVVVPAEYQEEIDKICEKVENFLKNKTEETEYFLDETNGFMRKLIFQTLYDKFPPKNYSVETRWIDNSPSVVIMKGKSKLERDKEIYEREKKELEGAIGFSNVFKLISQKKKPIVGHNMILDLIHILNRFFWPLPETYLEFKEMVAKIFPQIFDTKYLCSLNPFKYLIYNSVIVELMKTLQKPPFKFPEVEPEDINASYSSEICKAHEAGYDAYATGLCFLALATYLKKNKNKENGRLDFNVLRSYENRVFILRILDYSFMDLRNDEPVPNRNHVFYISFPKEWKTINIRRLFTDYSDVHISYISSSSAWVTLLNPCKAKLVTTELIRECRKGAYRQVYTIMTYNNYKQHQCNVLQLKEKLEDLPVVSEIANVTSTVPIPEPIEIKPVEKPEKKRSYKSSELPLKKKKYKRDLETECANVKTQVEQKEFFEETDYQPPTYNREKTRALFCENLKNEEKNLQQTFEEPAWE